MGKWSAVDKVREMRQSKMETAEEIEQRQIDKNRRETERQIRQFEKESNTHQLFKIVLKFHIAQDRNELADRNCMNLI